MLVRSAWLLLRPEKFFSATQTSQIENWDVFTSPPTLLLSKQDQYARSEPRAPDKGPGIQVGSFWKAASSVEPQTDRQALVFF